MFSLLNGLTSLPDCTACGALIDNKYATTIKNMLSFCIEYLLDIYSIITQYLLDNSED